MLGLNYSEGNNADVDMNIIIPHDSRIVEIQGTAPPFTRKKLNQMIDIDAVKKGLQVHFTNQSREIGGTLG